MATKTKAQKNNELTAANVVEKQQATQENAELQRKSELTLYGQLIRKQANDDASETDVDAISVIAAKHKLDADADLASVKKLAEIKQRYPSGIGPVMADADEKLKTIGEQRRLFPQRKQEEWREISQNYLQADKQRRRAMSAREFLDNLRLSQPHLCDEVSK